MNPVRKVGMILKRRDPRVRAVVSDIIPWLQSRGVQVILEQESEQQAPPSVDVVPAKALAGQADVVAVFGGDGTLLYAARMVAAAGIPIMGINLGSLGFLTEIKLEEMHEAFESLVTGNYRIEDRMLLEVRVLREESCLAEYMALNDAVINKGALARIIELQVNVNGLLMTVTRGDGLIIATPTGSTAYSLATGGPILFPTLAAFVITPISPHTLTNRPVVIPEAVSVEVRLRRGKDVMLTVDGQVGMPLVEQDRLEICKAVPTIRLIHAGSPFFKLLREKLKWE